MAIKSSTIGDGNVVILEPKGSFIGGNETDELKEILKKTLTNGIINIVIDFSNVSYLNSSAIGVLVVAHNEFKGKNGKMVFCNINKNIDNIFVVTKLTSLFSVEETRDEAIMALGK
jgi:anti-sigma B factor antagonist